jgi:hypothetical protein
LKWLNIRFGHTLQFFLLCWSCCSNFSHSFSFLLSLYLFKCIFVSGDWLTIELRKRKDNIREKIGDDPKIRIDISKENFIQWLIKNCFFFIIMKNFILKCLFVVSFLSVLGTGPDTSSLNISNPKIRIQFYSLSSTSIKEVVLFIKY